MPPPGRSQPFLVSDRTSHQQLHGGQTRVVTLPVWAVNDNRLSDRALRLLARLLLRIQEGSETHAVDASAYPALRELQAVGAVDVEWLGGRAVRIAADLSCAPRGDLNAVGT